MMMTPLRRPSDPNRAYETGLLRDSAVPHANGFMEWAGLNGKTLYADYEVLYGRHWRYFEDEEHARAAVELVLSYPEQVHEYIPNLFPPRKLHFPPRIDRHA